MKATYTVWCGGKLATYKGFDCAPRAYAAYCIPPQNDIAEYGTFYSDDPDIAGPELERFFREQWGRTVKIVWEIR